MNRYSVAAEGRQSCFARMLDVRGYVIAARAATASAPPGAALAMMLVFGVIALCLLPIWISFDLASTWEFTTGARDASEAVVYDLAARAEGILGMSVAALLAGLILTSFTLLPTLFELAFPTVNHPLLNMVLVASILFDFVTDWGKAWDTAAAWTQNPALHFVYTAAFCLFVSVGVQALLVVCVTVVLYAILALVRGPARDVQRVITLE
jgi:hypothetical protein